MFYQHCHFLFILFNFLNLNLSINACINCLLIHITGGAGFRSRSRISNGSDHEETNTVTDLDVDKEVTAYFVGSVSADQHYQGQTQNRDRYAAGMAVLEKNGVEIALSKLKFAF
jgi:hypothetical protein